MLWFLGIYAALLPLEQVLFDSFGVVTEWKPYRICILLLFVACCIGRLQFKPLGSPRINVYLGAIFVYGSIITVIWWNILGKGELDEAYHSLKLLFFGAISYWVISTSIVRVNALKYLFMGLLIGCILSIVIGSLSANSGLYRVSGLFKNPNSLGFLVSIVILYLIYNIVLHKNRVIIIVIGVGLVAWLCHILILTGSRAALFAGMIGLSVVVYRLVFEPVTKGTRKRAVLLIFGGILGIYSVNSFITLSVEDNILARFQIRGMRYKVGRLTIWQAGLAAADEYYYLGLGIGQYQRRHFEYLGRINHPTAAGLEVKLGLHSEFVTLLVEYGAIGLVLYLIVLKKIWAGVRRLSRKDFELRHYSILIEAVLVADIVFSMFNTMQASPLHWFVLGSAVGYMNVEKSSRRARIVPLERSPLLDESQVGAGAAADAEAFIYKVIGASAEPPHALQVKRVQGKDS